MNSKKGEGPRPSLTRWQPAPRWARKNTTLLSCTTHHAYSPPLTHALTVPNPSPSNPFPPSTHQPDPPPNGGLSRVDGEKGEKEEGERHGGSTRNQGCEFKKMMRGPTLPSPGGSQHPCGSAKMPPSYHAPCTMQTPTRTRTDSHELSQTLSHSLRFSQSRGLSQTLSDCRSVSHGLTGSQTHRLSLTLPDSPQTLIHSLGLSQALSDSQTRRLA